METLAKLSRNSLYAIVFHLAPRLTNVIIFILVGRLTGPSAAGTLSLATTYLLIFTAVMRGLDDLVIRQVSREETDTAAYFSSFLILRIGLSFIAWGILTCLVLCVFTYSTSTTSTILILSIGLLPENIACVAQAVLLGKQRFDLVAVSVGISSGIKLLGGIICLLLNKGLTCIVSAWVLGSLLNMLLSMLVSVDTAGSFSTALKPQVALLRKYKHTILTFLLITTLLTLETQADILLLDYFRGESMVGWYSAAITLVSGITLLSQAYQVAVYPLMTRYALNEPRKLRTLYQESLHYLGLVALPTIAGSIILAPQLVPIIFGDKFAPTISILQISIFSLLPLFLSTPVTRMMLVHNQQSSVSWFIAASVITNLLLNWILDPSWGANGAATAKVCSTSIYFLLGYIYLSRTIYSGNLLHTLKRCVLATAIMSGIVWFMRDYSVVLAIIAGAVAYFGLLWGLKDIPMKKYA